MNIDKAIEIKTDYLEHLPPGVNEDWITADRLSIEALELLREHRDEIYFRYDLPLPGETKE